jgi:hypothetical protein
MATPAETFMAEHINDYATMRQHYAYSLPDHALTFTTMDHLRRAVTASGSHFFDRDAIAFFNSRIGSTLYGHRFFVTSEAMDHDSPRIYSVRWVGRYTDSVCLQVDRFETKFADRDAAIAFAKLAAQTIVECDETTGDVR